MVKFLLKIITKAVLEDKAGENSSLISHGVLGAVVKMMVLWIGSFFLSVFLLSEVLSELASYLALVIQQNYLKQYDANVLSILIKVSFIIILVLISLLLTFKIKDSCLSETKNETSSSVKVFKIINAFIEGIASK